jgi:hypothetical protein
MQRTGKQVAHQTDQLFRQGLVEEQSHGFKPRECRGFGAHARRRTPGRL